MAIARLESQLLADEARGLKVKIVVPQVFLANQWAQALQEDLGVDRGDIGIYSGGHKDSPTRKYMIYVINSARHCLARHIREDYQRGKSIMLIADECHHYSSPENSRIFDFVTQIPAAAAFPGYYALGLSATPDPPTCSEKMVMALGSQVFKYGFAEALNANIISPFAIFNIKLKFTPDEELQYLDLSAQLARALEALMRRCPALKGLPSSRFFAALEQMARDEGAAGAGLARAVLILAHQRKDVVYGAASRVSCVVNLLDRISEANKVLIFNERIEVADSIFARLQRRFPGQVGRYHSEMDQRSRKNMLRRYRDSEIRILVSCRALDEGLNVPETDVGIIACSTGSPRQRIQRLGRILRPAAPSHNAYLYYLYIGKSNEEQEFLTDVSWEMEGLVPMLDLEYDHETQAFLHPSYQVVAERVLAYARRREWEPEIIAEVARNLECGKLGCEWWTSEEECRRRIQAASSRSQRNYWVTMRLMARVVRGTIA